MGRDGAKSLLDNGKFSFYFLSILGKIVPLRIHFSTGRHDCAFSSRAFVFLRHKSGGDALKA